MAWRTRALARSPHAITAPQMHGEVDEGFSPKSPRHASPQNSICNDVIDNSYNLWYSKSVKAIDDVAVTTYRPDA